MEINSSSSLSLVTAADGSVLNRVEYKPENTIEWYNTKIRESYRIVNGSWQVYSDAHGDYVPLTEVPPTWEQEYQEALLAQYPFEKRVREIAQNNVDAGTVMFKLARDFNFVELIKEYLKKLPR